MADVNAQVVAAVSERWPPHVLQQGLLRHHLARRFDQSGQELELGHCQMHGLAVFKNFALRKVHRHRAKAHGRCGRTVVALVATQQSLHTRFELGGAKGLGQGVVRLLIGIVGYISGLTGGDKP